jgi:hypothetical protein
MSEARDIFDTGVERKVILGGIRCLKLDDLILALEKNGFTTNKEPKHEWDRNMKDTIMIRHAMDMTRVSAMLRVEARRDGIYAVFEGPIYSNQPEVFAFMDFLDDNFDISHADDLFPYMALCRKSNRCIITQGLVCNWECAKCEKLKISKTDQA